ncbi:MAG: PAS domain-containing protein [Oceanibaculum sp.]
MVEGDKISKERLSAALDPAIADISARLTHPHHRQMFAYWRGKFAGSVPPSRQDIDPVEIPPAILPWLVLYTVHWVADRPRIQFRLVGTSVVQRYHRDSTGKYFEDVYDSAMLSKQMAAFSEVALKCQPAYAQLRLPVPERDFIPYERLLLPLMGEDGRVEGIIAVMSFAPH